MWTSPVIWPNPSRWSDAAHKLPAAGACCLRDDTAPMSRQGFAPRQSPPPARPCSGCSPLLRMAHPRPAAAVPFSYLKPPCPGLGMAAFENKNGGSSAPEPPPQVVKKVPWEVSEGPQSLRLQSYRVGVFDSFLRRAGGEVSAAAETIPYIFHGRQPWLTVKNVKAFLEKVTAVTFSTRSGGSSAPEPPP